MKNIEVSEELFESIQQLKGIFSEITGEEIEKDEEVLGILISGFIESMNPQGDNKCNCDGDHECNCNK